VDEFAKKQIGRYFQPFHGMSDKMRIILIQVLTLLSNKVRIGSESVQRRRKERLPMFESEIHPISQRTKTKQVNEESEGKGEKSIDLQIVSR
jgi:hypothetical protein